MKIMSALASDIKRLLDVPKCVQSLPVDSSLANVPRFVSGFAFAKIPLQPLAGPLRIIGLSRSALELLWGPEAPDLEEVQKNTSFLEYFSGSSRSTTLWSHRYWGTQFGNYAGQLGDGAAALIGQRNGFEVNLKGIGKSPFSRGFDGRKVVRSSVREFLCSEAMFGLGIPTTRAGTLIVSESDKVLRDVNYTGQPIFEHCAVVARIARTFIRFGSFESDDSSDDTSMLRQMAMFVWTEYWKKDLPQGNQIGDSCPLPADIMTPVIQRTAALVAYWQCVGFVHGVLNTDNMSIIGDTIDYGPFGFIESFDPYYMPNTSDKFGRYMYAKQPAVAAWNLSKLFEMFKLHEIIEQGSEWGPLERMFWEEYVSSYNNKMKKKLGLSETVSSSFQEIHDQFFTLLTSTAVDYTLVFRALSSLTTNNVSLVLARIMRTFPPTERVMYLSSVGQRIARESLPEIEEFAQSRISELEQVGIDAYTIKKWKFNFERMEQFETSSYGELKRDAEDKWRTFLTEHATRFTEESRITMCKNNPIYIPRQSLMQKAIDKIQNDHDSSELQLLLRLFQSPYELDPNVDPQVYEYPDLNDFGACLSCSS